MFGLFKFLPAVGYTDIYPQNLYVRALMSLITFYEGVEYRFLVASYIVI